VDPVLGGEVEERRQLVLGVRDPLDDLGVLGPVGPFDVADGPGRVFLVLGVVDLRRRAWRRAGRTSGARANECGASKTQ
jgi:hypothetical protein